MKPRIVLADDHEILLDALRSLLAAHFNVVATATDGATVVQLCRKMKPDVVVVDIGMPRLSGIQVAETMAAEKLPGRVICLTMQADADLIVRAFRAGVSGYVTKYSAGDELLFAIREVLAGRTFVSPRIGHEFVLACLKAPETANATATPPPFTTRQIEVLRLLADGKTMKEVAAALGISTRTAEAHKYQMMERHGVHSVMELIRVGIQAGIIDLLAPLSGGMPDEHRP